MQLTALSAESTATGTALLRLSAIFRLKCNAGIPRTDARSLGVGFDHDRVAAAATRTGLALGGAGAAGSGVAGVNSVARVDAAPP
jgi:hypothetical protein